jgi:hypothetical protein
MCLHGSAVTGPTLLGGAICITGKDETMGREVKRVPLDFDWPEKIWPGYMLSLCGDMEYVDKNEETRCDNCRHFARLAGITISDYGCPQTKIDPPTGEGWQMWEDVTEGSPISPVFATPEELARWLADTGASACGSDTATYEQWLAVITGPGWAPTMVVRPDTGLISGVAAMAAETQKG